MSKEKKKEAVIFVVNIGKSSVQIAENETESFLDKSKTVIKQVMERKIFMRKNDLVNVICIGANDTNNAENMDFINHLETELLVPTWIQIQNVLNLEGTQRTSVWVEGLHVALEYIKQYCTHELQVTPIVMVINDFQEAPDIIQQFDEETVANQVLASNAKLIVIGKTPNDQEHMSTLNPSERLALGVCAKAEGVYEQIDKYMWESRFYKNPSVKPSAWKCNLRIGDFIIPTETYVKVTVPPPFPSWKITTRDSSVGFPPESAVDVKRTKELVDRRRDVTKPEDAIKGFKYGGKFIPFSEQDLLANKFRGTEKSLIVRGFVKQEDLSLEYWFGKGSHIIVAQSSSKMKFYALLTAMKKAGLVAIVRKVYQINSVPKMGVLFPRMEEGEPVCFVHIGIPFAEERRVLKPRQMTSLPSDEHQNQVEELIDSMTLSEDNERFKPGNFCNPCKQTKYDNLAHRALNRVPLPPMDEALIDLISSPKMLLRTAEPVLNRIAEWVKPKVEVKKAEAVVKSVENDQNATEKIDDDFVKATEEAENKIKKEEELFNEIDQSAININQDFLNEM